MPRYYCDYCDTYLTHDSPSVRKQHNAGYKHKANVRAYYQQFEEQQTQSLIDARIREHLSVAPQGAGMPPHMAGVRPPSGLPLPSAGARASMMAMPGQPFPPLGPPLMRPGAGPPGPPGRPGANGSMLPGPPRMQYPGAPPPQRPPYGAPPGGGYGGPGAPAGYGYSPAGGMQARGAPAR